MIGETITFAIVTVWLVRPRLETWASRHVKANQENFR